MATIKIKRSGTTGQTPTSLDTGELAINYHKDDALLYWKDSDGNVKSTYLKNAPIDSPVFTGEPETTKPNAADDSDRIPTTSWVQDEIAGISVGATDVYKTITDGSTSAVASGSDTFKIRTSGSGISAVVGSNDGTHGDNLLLSLDSELQLLSGVTPTANAVPYFTSATSADVFTVTSAARDILDDTTTSAMRTSLGLGSISTQDASSVTITGGSISGITDLAIADGGTGASSASAARTNLGLGSIATQDASSVTITGGSISGITDLAIADGGTGASTASGARTNLELGSMALEATTSYYTKTATDAAFQPIDSTLTSFAAYNTTGLLTQTAADTFTGRTISAGVGINVTNGNGVSGNPTIAISHLGFQSLTDPNANRFIFWDDTAGNLDWAALPVTVANGGTGLTTLTAANNALYSSSSSALTAGTLPVAAGGTGQISYTNGQLLIGNTTGNTLAKATLTQGTGLSITNGAGSITLASLPRVSSTSSITSPLAWNSDNYDLYAATAQSTNFTINADSGTPTDGQKAVFRVCDNGTTRTITFTGGASKAFKPIGVTLTASGSNFTYATTASKTVYFGCIYNGSSSRWEIIALSLEA